MAKTTTADVEKLAALARIGIAHGKLEAFTKEFDAILAYVDKLQELHLPDLKDAKPVVRNIFREDGHPHEAGKYTERLVAQFPAHEGNELSVRQIIQND